MPTEIERKFLVTSDAWRKLVPKAAAAGARYRQGYLTAADSGGGGPTVRVRTTPTPPPGSAFLTIKGPSDAAGLTRDEFEYPIPVADADEILARLCVGPVIDKTRYHIPVHDSRGILTKLTWEVDEFHGANAGLVVAELELPTPDHPVPRTPWIGREVTADPKYRNANLVQHPYAEWTATERAQPAQI